VNRVEGSDSDLFEDILGLLSGTA